MENKKGNGLIMQAGILAAAGFLCRIIGLLYNTPLLMIIGDEGNGYYDSAYAAYSIVLLISSYSIPSAVSKVIAQKLAKKEYKNAHRIFRCALLYVLVVGFVAALLVFIFASSLVKLDGAILPLRILAPTIFFSGILGVLRGYFQAHSTMVQTSLSQIVEQIFNAGFSVLMAYLLVNAATGKEASVVASYGAAGGTIGTGAGVLSALIFMGGIYFINKKSFQKRMDNDKHENVDSYKDILKLIIMVVTPFLLSTCIYNVNTFLDKYIYQVISVKTYGHTDALIARELSVYSKATKLINIPVAIASAMATALIPGVSSAFVIGDMKDVINKVTKSTKVTMLIAIPSVFGMGVLSMPIMKVIFPQKDTIVISSIMLSTIAVTIVLNSLSTLSQAVLQSIGKMNTPLLNAGLALVIHVVVMVLCMLYLNPDYAIYYYAGTTILYALLLALFNELSVHKNLKLQLDLDKTYLRPFLCSLAMGAVAILVYLGLYFLIKINIISLFVAVLAGASTYFVLILKSKTVSEDEFSALPKGKTLLKIAKKVKLL